MADYRPSYYDVARLLKYDPESGYLFRISGQHRNRNPIAGLLRDDGYIRVKIGKDAYYAHVIAWLLQTYFWPEVQIDHINGNRSDNRWVNLREATRQDNSANCKVYSNNKCGFKGVYQGHNCWRADIKVSGKTLHLGSFQSPEAAHEAYMLAAQHYFGEFANAG